MLANNKHYSLHQDHQKLRKNVYDIDTETPLMTK